MIVDSVASCCQQKYVFMLLLIKFFEHLTQNKSLGSIKTFHFTRVLSSWRHSLFERLSLCCEAIYKHLFKMIHRDCRKISRNQVTKIITFLIGWRTNFTHLCWHCISYQRWFTSKYILHFYPSTSIASPNIWFCDLFQVT